MSRSAHTTEHASVPEARGLAGRRAGSGEERILDVGVQVPKVVSRLREITLPFERRRHPVPVDVVAEGAGIELGVEVEEQLVLAAWAADRPANREAQSISSRRLRCREMSSSESVHLELARPKTEPRTVLRLGDALICRQLDGRIPPGSGHHSHSAIDSPLTGRRALRPGSIAVLRRAVIAPPATDRAAGLAAGGPAKPAPRSTPRGAMAIGRLLRSV